MQKISAGYSWYFNNKYKRTGSLFQGTFKAKHISENDYFLHSSAYINVNDKVHSLGPLGAKCEVLLDGGLRASKRFVNQKTIIRGDATVPIIGLASILAKVHRDRYMTRSGIRYLGWGFEKHKGYGTAAHYKSLKKHGLSPIHRVTFTKM